MSRFDFINNNNNNNSKNNNKLDVITAQSSASNLIEFDKIYENLICNHQESTSLHKPASHSLSSTSFSSSSLFAMQNNYYASTAFSTPLSASSSCSSLSFNSSTQQRLIFDHKKLFVGNLPLNTKLCELLNLFKKFGKINEKLCVVKDQNYAFIHYYNDEEAKFALCELNNSLFKDRYIRVQYSTSQAHIKKLKTFDDNNMLINNVNNTQSILKREFIPNSNESALYTVQKPAITSLLRPIKGGNRCLLNKSKGYIQQQKYLFESQKNEQYKLLLHQQLFNSKFVGMYEQAPQINNSKSSLF